MKLKYKLLVVVISTALPLIAYDAFAEDIIQKQAVMSDGTEVTVIESTNANAAAQSMKVKRTTSLSDVDKDGYINNDEVIKYVTRNTDKNNDGFIDNAEYEDGAMSYFSNRIAKNRGATQSKSYTHWDKDKDNRLNVSEVKTLIANKGLYENWDLNKDGKIDTLEFSQATFRVYDKDNNGSISITEWADVVM